MMRAIAIARPGGPEVLEPVEVPLPVPGPGQVRIRISHAGVNRPDCLQRAGLYAPPKGASPLPGLECAGRVDAVGHGVSWPREGDAVCALLPGGGYAEAAVTEASHCLPVPEGMGMHEAACLPETFFTVWSNVFQRGGLGGGERFLVHGGSSGIGTTAIQLAHAFGARVFATAGSAEKCALCTALGAERAINYRTEDFVPVLTAAGGADVILDMVGGSYIPRNLAALAEGGRLVQIAFLQGAKAEVNLAGLMMKRQWITGSTLRPQSPAAKAAIAESLRREVWPRLSPRHLWPLVDAELPLEDAAEAHRLMESSAHMGKIVLRVSKAVGKGEERAILRRRLT